MQSPMNLLFITSNRLGDAVLSTGLLAAALERFNPTAVTVACGPIPAPLFAGVPNIARIIPLKKEKNRNHWLQFWLYAVTKRWDVMIDVRNSFTSYVLPARRAYRFYYGDRTKHKAVQLAGILGLKETPPSTIWLTDKARGQAAAWLPDGPPILALCPTANWAGKIWPAENFIALAHRLSFKRVAIFGAVGEEAQAAPIIKALAPDFDVIDLVGRTDPLQAAACLACTSLCVANDSGLMHIAAAMGTPTIGLFGPSNDVEYSPWGARTAFIRAMPYDATSPDPQALMRAIRVEDVIARLKELLG